MVVRTTTARALVPVTGATLVGDLSVPVAAPALILLPHGGSGGARSHRRLAAALGGKGLATLCLSLLTQTEDVVDARTGHFRFDIPLLATRLIATTDWVLAQSATSGLRVGYFGAGTGAAAALVAAAARPNPVSAVVCQSGRPDLAVHVLDRVQAPTLLIVGGDDLPVIELNRDALKRLHVEAVLQVVPGASHLFDEPGAMDTVADLARGWFERHLGRASDS